MTRNLVVRQQHPELLHVIGPRVAALRRHLRQLRGALLIGGGPGGFATRDRFGEPVAGFQPATNRVIERERNSTRRFRLGHGGRGQRRSAEDAAASTRFMTPRLAEPGDEYILERSRDRTHALDHQPRRGQRRSDAFRGLSSDVTSRTWARSPNISTLETPGIFRSASAARR